MNQYLSTKLKVLSLMLTVLVVYLHSYNVMIKFDNEIIELNKGYSFFIQEFLSRGIAKIAVPLFFAISGYLFFLNTQGTLNEFIVKIKKRVKTVFIPYLVWSLWGILIYFILQALPFSKQFFTKQIITDHSFQELFHIFVFDPIPYQLWFLRDLMILSLLSPLIYYVLKYLKILALLIMGIIWFWKIDLLLISNESLLFFCVGGYLSLEKNSVLHDDYSKKAYQYLISWLTVIFAKTYITMVAPQNNITLLVLLKLSIILGIITIWLMYDKFYRNTQRSISNVVLFSASFTFFIYAFHEPILTIFKKGFFFFIGQGELASLIIFIITPLLTITLGIFLGFYMKKLWPSFYGVMTGQR
ncbi:MAG: acyltransferase [Pseudomonadota bacterium]